MDAFAKPLDEKLILELATNHELVITIEEGSVWFWLTCDATFI